jgi:hypothetical protein
LEAAVSPQNCVRRVSFNRERAAHIEKDQRGQILAGRLVERDGVTEEKLVDVLCALQIARLATLVREGNHPARAIVVVSEDIDIPPAYVLAEELGVPTYAAANQTVHTRGHRWIVLGDDALLDMCGAPGQRMGHTIRQEIVRLASTTAPVTVTARFVDHGNDTVVFDHTSGAQGTLPVSSMPRAFARGISLSLYVHGIDLGVGRRQFPRLLLGVTAATAPPAALVAATVERWRGPTTISVRMPSGASRSVGAPLGRLLPGMRVLLHVDKPGSPRYVGPIGKPSLPTGAGRDPAPDVIQVTGRSSVPRLWTCEVISTGRPALLSLPEHETPDPFDRYAAACVDYVMSGGAVMPVRMGCSSRLP